VLRHLATIVYHYVKSKNPDEQEVQAMEVNDRLFLASNDPASMELVHGLDAAKLGDLLSGRLLRNGDDRAKRAATKLQLLLSGERLDSMTFDDPDERYEVESIAAMLNGAAEDPSSLVALASGIQQAAGWIDDEDHEGMIVFVSGLSGAHAEQNLIIAYALSGSDADAHVYGKKRPCTGCFLTFKFAEEKLGKKNLHYSRHPGGFWSPALNGLYELMKQDASLSLDGVEGFVQANLPSLSYRTARDGDKGKRKKRTNTSFEDTGNDSGSDTEPGED
jgi:hypothetical protein